MKISATLQNQFADAIDTAIGATGFARFYTGTAASPGTKLATCAMNNPAFGNAATGVITMGTATAVNDTSPVAGTAALLGLYANSTAASSAYVVAMAVAATGADITMSNPAIVTTDTVQVSSLTITVPTGTE